MSNYSSTTETHNRVPEDSHVDAVFMVLHRLLGILGWILVLPVLTLCLVIVGYVVSLIIADLQGRTDNQDTVGSERISEMIMTLWDRALPIATELVGLFAPILVLLLVVAGIRFVMRDAAGAANVTRLFSDLPSVLAIMIVAAICLIPYTRVSVPEALNNIALVVVGFYFGRGRRRAELEGPVQPRTG